MAALSGALVLGLLGLTLLIGGRREGSWVSRIALAGVGPVSRITTLVGGLALLVLGYQLGARALGVAAFRVPGWAAVALPLGAVGLSLVSDAIDNRRGGQ
ncbi:MAG TPA: hypothetical protein DEB06_10990 [Phycisphaerales bacterium]|nr:hypothetical protein [Phycisphaerales bacterium]